MEYAHRQFVVHRDLKPGNILVDKSGSVKLLDFGICKLLHADAIGRRETMTGAARMLTPDYASPEQIHGDPITVASDVYSLAAVLYELLTGASRTGSKSTPCRQSSGESARWKSSAPAWRRKTKQWRGG